MSYSALFVHSLPVADVRGKDVHDRFMKAMIK